MDWLIVLGVIAGYLAIGGLYARSQAVRLWQDSYDKERETTTKTRYRELAEEWDRNDRRHASQALLFRLGWRVPAWPYAMLYDFFGRLLRDWLTSPVTDRQERAEQLREDAEAWDAKRHDGTAAEREMAAELARICRERAEEIDL
jgi:hypothetical protein